MPTPPTRFFGQDFLTTEPAVHSALQYSYNGAIVTAEHNGHKEKNAGQLGFEPITFGLEQLFPSFDELQDFVAAVAV